MVGVCHPYPPTIGPRSPPPPITRNPSERIENQEPAREQSGARLEGKEVEDKPLQASTLDDVQIADLKDTERLLQLHDQAVAHGLVTTSDADRLWVAAAAEHTLAVGKANPAGLFAWLVWNRAWRYLTGEDEDRANARIKGNLRGPEPSKVSAIPTPFASSRSIELGLSEDARVVREIRAATIRAGIYRDPFQTVRARDPR
jgi:hypothetical protein